MQETVQVLTNTTVQTSKVITKFKLPIHKDSIKIRLNTDGDVQIGGSFDGRERVQDMIKSRHLAAKIPASKITYKQGPSIQKGGMKIP